MFLASLVCRAKDCRSGRTKVQGGTIGGKQNGNLWLCGIFSNVGSRPGPFFFFSFLGFACVSGNVSHVSTLSCPFRRALSGFWLGVVAPLFVMGRVLFSPAAGQEADSPAVQRSATRAGASLIPGKLN